MNGNGNPAWVRSLPILYEAQTLDALPSHLVNFLAGLISSETASFNEVDLKLGRMTVTTDPPELKASARIQDLAAIIQEHPLVRHQQETGDLSAYKISDILSRAQFHETSVYQEVYRHLNCEDQIAFSLHASPDTIIAIALNRNRRTFTEEQRQLLNLLRPHLVQVYRNAQLLTALQQKLSGMTRFLDGLPLGLLVLDRRHQIKFASERARKLLESYFQHPPAEGRLPAALSTWLSQSRQWQGQALPNPTGAFHVDGPGGRLAVRSTQEPGSDETVLVLEERQTKPSAQSLRSLGLTVRESEVLLWVSQGKTNPEIAIILGAAPRTVQKHLERIYCKLGVESRTAAARRALEVLNG